MDIISALKSGKRCRRKSWSNENAYYLQEMWLSKDDILADDWEVEPDPEPKLKAWIYINSPHGVYKPGDVWFDVRHNGDPDPEYWKRAEWLDQKDQP